MQGHQRGQQQAERDRRFWAGRFINRIYLHPSPLAPLTLSSRNYGLRMFFFMVGASGLNSKRRRHYKSGASDSARNLPYRYGILSPNITRDPGLHCHALGHWCRYSYKGGTENSQDQRHPVGRPCFLQQRQSACKIGKKRDRRLR